VANVARHDSKLPPFGKRGVRGDLNSTRMLRGPTTNCPFWQKGGQGGFERMQDATDVGRTKRSESTKPAKRPVIVDNLSVGTLADLEKVLDELGTWEALATANQGRRG